MTEKNFKIYKLRAMDQDQLGEQLEKFREELYQLRTSKVVGATATKLGRIRVPTPTSFTISPCRLLEKLSPGA